MQKWEYLVYIGPGGHFTETKAAGGWARRHDDLDELGEKGWELVTFDPTGPYATCYFKRPKP